MKRNLTKLDNIKVLFEQINDKEEFYYRVSKEFNIKSESARTNWFKKFNITDKYKLQDNLIVFMQNFIANQNNVSV